MPPRTTYIGGDSDDDEEEETVDLRVSASRQDEDLNKSGKRPVFKRIPSSTSTVKSFRQSGNSGTGHHIIDLNETERRPAAPLYEFTKQVFTATTQNVYVSGVADTVAEAMQLLPNPFSTVGGTTSRQASKKQEMYGFEPNKEEYLQENHSRLKLLAFWQLLITGFEVLNFSIGQRAKPNVLWLALDGKLYMGSSKKEKKTAKWLFLADLFRIQKGNDTQPFAKSQSWRDIRGKDNLTFSIHGRQGKEERIFAIQVWKPSVRNTLVESFDLLLRMMKSDPDGDFPYVAQRVIAQHYAQTGEILTLRQVEDELLREEDEKKTIVDRDRHSSDDDHSSDGSNVSEDEGDQSNILG